MVLLMSFHFRFDMNLYIDIADLTKSRTFLMKNIQDLMTLQLIASDNNFQLIISSFCSYQRAEVEAVLVLLCVRPSDKMHPELRVCRCLYQYQYSITTMTKI